MGSLLIRISIVKANMQAEESDRLPESQIRGQIKYVGVSLPMANPLIYHSSTFVFAGHETTRYAQKRPKL